MATDYGTRPSVFMGLMGDPIVAYAFDKSIWLHGRQVNAQIDKERAKGKTPKLEHILSTPDNRPATFADMLAELGIEQFDR